MSGRIGFMQGRLCEPVGGMIQAFPVKAWRDEFPIARSLGIEILEWTLDQDGLRQNPLLADAAGTEAAAAAYNLSIRSITCDCFMQAPFFKAPAAESTRLLDDMRAIVVAAGVAQAAIVVIPLVDNGTLRDSRDERTFRDGMLELQPLAAKAGVRFAVESDFEPERLAKFVDGYPSSLLGINYDIGNSASLGFDPEREIRAYGSRIINVHVKDRILGGTTVPLGEGSADFPRVFRALRKASYGGDFILQTARAKDGDHAGAIARYRSMTEDWWLQAGAGNA